MLCRALLLLPAATQWGAIERAPGQYGWMGYKQLFEMVRSVGLKLQVVLSFHACGGNVGDMAQVPLPPWVLQVRVGVRGVGCVSVSKGRGQVLWVVLVVGSRMAG